MSKKDDKSTLKLVAIGGVVAGAVGYLAGLLTAPKSGKETRTDIKNTANDTYAKAEKELKKLNNELSKAIDEAKIKGDKLSAKAKNEVSELIEKAKDTKEKVREVISAIHEGDAEDKDLKKAVKEAKNALDALNSYFKK